VLLVLVIGLVALFSGCGGGGGTSGGGTGGVTIREIGGQVLDEQSEPISGALVALYLNQRPRADLPYAITTSANDGTYEFNSVPEVTGIVEFWRTQEEYESNPNSPMGSINFKVISGNLSNINLVAWRFDDMEWKNIPAGEFVMGSPEGPVSERPQHNVYLDAYQIGKYEITNAQFARFIEESGYALQGNWRNFGDNTPADYPDNYPNYPVMNISWNDAKAFCDWASAHWVGWEGCHLPTEAQWEKAARGTDGNIYPWGNDWDAEKCNNFDCTQFSAGSMLNINSGRGTLPVGSFPAGASTYGVMDMAGNVWEFCADWYDGFYYTVSPYRNPQGPENGTYKTLRGESWWSEDWMDNAFWFRSASRGQNQLTLDEFYPVNGFRCARPMPSYPPAIEWVTIPAGEFTMGSPDEEGYADERPQHIVNLDEYQIEKYEVTNAQFARFIEESGYAPEGDWRHFNGSPADYPDNYPNYPVIRVSWNDIKAFCDYASVHWAGWEGCRLPTEAEWEKAARGTDTRTFPWGNDWDASKCNNWFGAQPAEMLNISNGRGVLPVGYFLAGASQYGVLDMAGNVGEFVSDWYDADYYSVAPYSNPTGPDTGFQTIIRGGSWSSRDGAGELSLDFFRCSFRNAGGSCPTDWYSSSYGFRCARIAP